MARRRDYKAEYARRVRRARERGYTGYYPERIERAQKRHPGISRGDARGHGSGVSGFLRQIRRLPPGSSVSFTGIDRQSDGTWRRARFDVFPGDGADESTTIVAPRDLGRLGEIRDALAATGILVLGAQYLARMAASLEEQLYAIRGRTGRWLSRLDKRGHALTRPALDDRVMISTDEPALQRFLHAKGLLRRGYRVIAL